MRKSYGIFLFVFVLILLSIGFIYFNPSSENTPANPPVTVPVQNEFILGAMNNRNDANYNNIANPDVFGMNLWHYYSTSTYDSITGKYYPKGWTDNDTLFCEKNGYSQDIIDIISANSNHGMKTLMARPKIEYLAYGERSDYQCEYVDPESDLWFYAFQSPGHIGIDIPDSGATVRYCEVDNNQTDGGAGWVVSKVKASNEQTNIERGTSYNPKDDSQWRWFIKPRIRIDSNFAHNNQTTPVCSLKIMDSYGSMLKEVVIKGANFLNTDGNYDGRYMEQFYNLPEALAIQGAWGPHRPGWRSRGNVSPDWHDGQMSEADIQVYWYGNCDMWIDYVRVDNEVAHQLFRGDFDNTWLQWEADIANANSSTSPYVFYIEEFQFNNIPCIAYVNNFLKQKTNNNIGMMACFYWKLFFSHMNYYYQARTGNWTESKKFDYEILKRVLMDRAGLDMLFTETYPFAAHDFGDPVFSKIPNTLSTNSGECILASTDSPSAYDDWLQNLLDDPDYPNLPAIDIPVVQQYDEGWQGWTLRLASDYSKMPGSKPFINMLQTHLWRNTGVEVRREPTNEEIRLQANLSLSYGAKGLIFFWYGGLYGCADGYMGRGYLNNEEATPPTTRQVNAYGQPKWDSLVRMHKQIRKWAPYFYGFNSQYTGSYTYFFSNERSDFLDTYFNDIKTYPPDISDPNIPGSTPEDADHTYLQAATFKNTGTGEEYNKYFMLVNRRCSPYYPNGDNGGRRYVKVKFDANPTELAAFNNWKIINVADSSVVATFDKQVSSYIDLGWYMPGEGRLYKIAPVMTEGGTLVVNESFGGVSFTCKDTVLNDGKNITITGTNSSISFTDSASIIMTGGTFQSSTPAGSGPGNKNVFQGSNSQKWNGLSFNGSIVKMYDAKFLDISSPAVNHAVKMLNCPLGDLRNNVFTMNTDTSGAVYSVYTGGDDVSYSLYVNYNTITMNNSRTSAIQVHGFSGLTMPLYANNNTMTSNGYATGILLSTITGGVINENSLTGFATGINALFSSVDMFGNYVTNTVSLSDGVLAADGSFLNMTNNGSLVIGGMNTFTNTYDGTSVNMHLVNSLFEMEEGTNIFDITSTANVNAYHIYGTYPEVDSYNPNQLYNCFKFDGLEIEDPDLPVYDITMGGNPVTLNFIPYQCWAPSFNGNTIVNIGNGLYDTIPNVGVGEGGGHSSVKKKFIVANAKTLFDSISIQIRYRDYEGAKNNCYELIENYPDSVQSLEVLSTLYLSVISSDTAASAMIELKTFYENLILNNSENASMIINSNYLIQKCKVKLRQYESALSGFQQIINNNPYSYLGLLARWDYMATSLLVQGQGGAYSSIDNDQLSMNNYDIDGNDDDKKPFTKEQKKVIRETVKYTNETNRDKEEVKVKVLEEKSAAGDLNASKELTQMKLLKEIVKTDKPKSITEHMNIVNNDIQKVFSKDIKISSNQNNTIPLVFRISQNYPNPFNPVTKINYDLPRDSKVNIVIYDILGREVKRLVNNELKTAGSYIVDFNATNYASGVYFYRIEAEEPNGNKFVDSKKMVLLK